MSEWDSDLDKQKDSLENIHLSQEHVCTKTASIYLCVIKTVVFQGVS